MAEHSRASRSVDHARTQLAYGDFLRRSRRRVDARAPLRAALDIFTGETVRGSIVFVPVPGTDTRTVISSVVVAEGAFKGVGRFVEVAPAIPLAGTIWSPAAAPCTWSARSGPSGMAVLNDREERASIRLLFDLALHRHHRPGGQPAAPRACRGEGAEGATHNHGSGHDRPPLISLGDTRVPPASLPGARSGQAVTSPGAGAARARRAQPGRQARAAVRGHLAIGTNWCHSGTPRSPMAR
jgi:hypothetical protein